MLGTLTGQRLVACSVQVPLSLMIFELSGYNMNTVQLHVHPAGILVRRGEHREAPDNRRLRAAALRISDLERTRRWIVPARELAECKRGYRRPITMARVATGTA